MLKKLRKLKLGYISIEVVILASIILVSGFSFLGAFVKNGQLASNDAANKIDSVLELAGGGSGELPGGGLPGGGSFGDDFPIEWNTKEASTNVSAEFNGVTMVKVSDFLPSKEMLEQSECRCPELDMTMKAPIIYQELVEEVSLFGYEGYEFVCFIVKEAGTYQNDGWEVVLTFPESGFYVIDYWGMMGGDMNFVIDIPETPEALPTSFPIEWNTKEASVNPAFEDPFGNRYIKVGNFLPTEGQMRSSICQLAEFEYKATLEFYAPIDNGISFFLYRGSDAEGYIIEKSGEYEIEGESFTVSEPGFYILDFWGMFGEELDFVIDIKTPVPVSTSFPIEWNTEEVFGNPNFEDLYGDRYIKVGNFSPTEEQMRSSICQLAEFEYKATLEFYEPIDNGISFFAYRGGDMVGFIIEKAGEYEIEGDSFTVPEPGFYVLDLWGMFGEELDFVIDIPEPPSFPIEWSASEAAENNPTVKIWGDPFVKVSDMIPATEDFLTTKLVENHEGSTSNYDLISYSKYSEAITFFEYGGFVDEYGYTVGVLTGYIVKSAGYSEYFDVDFPEPGIYVSNISDVNVDFSINTHKTTSTLTPGLYEPGSITAYMKNGAVALEGKLIMSFYDLLDEGVVRIEYGSLVHIEVAPMSLRATYHCILQGDLFLPDTGIISGRIKEYTFKNCNSITGILVPEGATSIGGLTFTGASSLKTIALPKSLEYIGYRAFEEATLLADVYYAGTESEWNAISIDGENEELLNATVHFNSRISK